MNIIVFLYCFLIINESSESIMLNDNKLFVYIGKY